MNRALALAGLTALAGAAPARAAEPVRADAFRPKAAAIYAGDRDAESKLRVEEIFGMFLVDPPRRHAIERVELAGDDVIIHYWQPLGTFSDAELLTRAATWFLLGRTQFSPGVRAVFSEMPEVKQVVLVFNDVQRKDQKGRRLGEELVTPYLKVRLTRARFERLKLDLVQKCRDKGDCSAVFRAAFDEARFERKGLRAR